MEVIHEGILEIGYKEDSRSSKDWKPRLFVLKYYPTSDRSTLDYYKNTSKRWQKQSIKGVISLWPQFAISIAHQCSYKYSLKLCTSEQVVYLAASNVTAMNKWFYFIQTQQKLNPTPDMYVFTVQAQDSDSMTRIGAINDCQLVLTPNFEVQLALLPRKEIVCIWPFDCLKTFSYGHGLFSFTSGRHAPHGSGDFSFITTQDRLIHDTLQKLINRAQRNSTSSYGSSSRASIGDRPPAKLPQDNRSESSSTESPSSNEGDDLFSHNHVHMSPSKMANNNVYTTTRESNSPPPLPHQPPPRLPPKGVANKSWLHERYGGSLEDKGADDNKENDTEHVYSKTVHYQGKNVQSPVSEENPLVYNLLVHKGSIKKPRQDYDIAFPEPNPIIEGNMYSHIAGEQPTENKRMSTTASVMTPPTSSPPTGTTQEGMTANPLYGSSGNLLEAISSSTSFSSSIEGSLPPPIPPLVENTDEDKTKNSRPDVTANPVYVTTNMIKEQLPPATPPVRPPKNSFGYTEINKSSSQEDDSSNDDKPPPIPQRLLSESDHNAKDD